MLFVLRQMVWRRRMAMLWWSLGLVAAVALLAVAYPTVRDAPDLDRTFAGLPPSVQDVLGIGGANAITAPVGYLNSQYFTNIFPVMLLVFAIGLAAWTIAGDEAAGTLELLIANPVSRFRVALERAGGLVLLLAVLAAVSAGALMAAAPASGLSRGLTPDRMVAATVACALLALTFAAVAFAVGAATGNPRLAATVAGAAAAAGYLVEGLGQQIKALRGVQEASPWHWLLASDPLRNGLVWRSWALPVATAALLIAIGLIQFARRDLH